jgi:hypothetical protein
MVRALFDSGSSRSFLKRDINKQLKCTLNKENQCISSFSGNETHISESIDINVIFESKKCNVKFLLLDDSPFDAILGTDSLSSLNVQLNFSCASDTSINYDDMISKNITKRQNYQLTKCLKAFDDVFSKSDLDLGHCKTMKHSIDVGQATPFKSKQYPIPEALKVDVKHTIDNLLKHGIVRHSESPWTNPFFFIKKKDGRFRFIIDFRKLNDISKTDCFPVPLIDDIFSSLGGCKYFTSLDMTSGYYQIELDEASKEKTAFSIEGRLLEFNRLPFGLKNAPALFQRIMQMVLVDTGIMPYIDDIIIASQEFDQHLASIRTVLTRFRSHNLKLKPSKCIFAAEKLLYLGMLISEKGMEPDPDKVRSLRDIPSPKSNKDVERLCGFINYLGRFIPNLSFIMEPIFQCKRSKGSKAFVWGNECQHALDKIKEIVSESMLLKFPNFQRPFTLSTDASGVAVAAVLEQDSGPIIFASRSLNQAERNYSTTDREFLALVWGIKKFKQYLYGRQFHCKTDHKPLIHMIKSSPINSRHARYLQMLEEYDFSLSYIPGVDNIAPDALSRMTADETCCASEQNKVLSDYDILETIKRHHEYGHLGADKTVSSLTNSNIWFSGMHAKVKKIVNECIICAQNKSYGSHCPQGSLPHHEAQPFEVVCIDLVGPFNTSINGHRYILTMIDCASRWAEAIPLTNIRAETVAKALVNTWIHRFGSPRYVISDNGTQFVSSIFKELAEKYQFKHKFSTVYHPQGNSIVERLHREIKDRIRCLSGSWVNSLQDAVWHHNRTDPVDKKNVSPFQYLYGRGPTIPIEWPDANAFKPYTGKCPRFACTRNFNARSLEARFNPPLKVAKRICDQLIKLNNGRVVHMKNCRVIW